MEAFLVEFEAEIKPLHPVIEKFKKFIETDPEIYMFFNQMFTQVPFKFSPLNPPQIKSYEQMLRLMNAIMTKTPEWRQERNKAGLRVFLINAILDCSV